MHAHYYRERANDGDALSRDRHPSYFTGLQAKLSTGRQIQRDGDSNGPGQRPERKPVLDAGQKEPAFSCSGNARRGGL